MAYAAVISLKRTIEYLINSSEIWICPRYRVITECAEEVKSVEEVLKRLDHSSKGSSRKRVNALDEQIREALFELEDVLESYLQNQILSQSELYGDGIRFFIDMQYLKQDIESFTRRVKKMEEEYVKELDNPLPDEEADAASPRIDHGGEKTTVVGLSDELSKMKDQLTSQRGVRYEFQLRVFSLFGMAGIGKTTIAKEIFEDPCITECFNCRVWVTAGRNCQLNKIRRDMLAQLNPEAYEMLKETERDDIILGLVRRSLEGQRYLIVLDDVWDREIFYSLNCFPFQKNGSAVVLTTRLQEVRRDSTYRMFRPLKMRLLNEKESWDLLCKKVFAEESCPSHLEKPGKKIAKNCEGLPLTIVTVADLLSKTEKTLDYWNKVAEKENSVFDDAYDEISKVLFPSYDYLPQHLKACFLYMGVFPENYEIPRSKLISMWISEGFLQPNTAQTSEECAMKYLEELFCNSLVIIYQFSSIESWILGEQIKTCGLHSSFWHLCNKEARKSKFFHVLNSLEDGRRDGIKSQRRLCIRNNILFGIQDVYESVEDDCAPTTRSLLCYGPYHQYPLPICFGLRLLRVLDALNIRFYEFPTHVVKLVQLRYFALTFNGNLPTSISQLQKLQFLIVRRHLSIKVCESPSYLPIEIWDMKELKCLQIMGSDLPDPSSDTLLPNLQKLLDVSARSCTAAVLGRLSNLKKLGIQIELAPNADEPLCWFDHISKIRRLESLKCVIMNPEFEVVAAHLPISIFPWGLRKLTLSGFGYPWEDMETLASFLNLEVLKLQCYAFRGPKWEIKGRRFMKLSSLVVEDTDLVQWKVGYESLPSLVCLSIKHCYKLQELCWEHDKFLPKIEIVDCNPLAVTRIKQMIEAASGKIYSAPDVYVHSSWNDGNLKSSLATRYN